MLRWLILNEKALLNLLLYRNIKFYFRIMNYQEPQLNKHQELKFLDSKLVFFFPQNLQTSTNKKFNKQNIPINQNKSILQSRQSFNINKSESISRICKTKNIIQSYIGMTQDVCQARNIMKNKLTRNCITSTTKYRQKCHDKQNQKSQCSKKSKTKSKGKILDKNKVQSQILKLQKQQTKDFETEVQQYQQRIQQEMKKINHESIKLLFGQHHGLYKCFTDYLIQNNFVAVLQHKQRQNETKKRQGISQNMQNLNLKIHLNLNTRQDKQQSISLPLTSVNTLTNQYQFQKKRAPITFKMNKKAQREPYKKLINHNFKNRKFLDQQFYHQDYPKIGGQSVTWVYIAPNPSLNIFPKYHKQLNKNNKLNYNRLIFVNFMKCLYEMEPYLFERLLQPPINNVFSVWLFYEGRFQPIIIDGYFPTNSKDEIQFDNYNYILWLQIFTKCICKLYRTFDLCVLQKISQSQIYTLLTGQNLNLLQLSNSSICEKQLTIYYKKKISQGKKIVIKQQNYFKELKQKQIKKFICLLKSKSGEDQQKVKFISIPTLQNYEINQISVFNQTITKFEVLCQKRCEMMFNLCNERKRNYSKAYIYKSVDQLKQSNRLQLQYQINPAQSKIIKLTKGSYKIFYEDGQEMMKNIFQTSFKNKAAIQQKEFIITIMGNNLPKMSKGQPLFRNGDKIQDSQSFYF